MAVPGEGSRDIPLRVTKAGAEAIEAEASRLGKEKNEVIRIALDEYFQRQGRSIQFSPERGGKRTRMTEGQAVERVLRHIRALGLPEPSIDFRLGHKTYDLAWPEKRAAVEVTMRKRPADTNGWTVVHIKPTMADSTIDKALRQLPL